MCHFPKLYIIIMLGFELIDRNYGRKEVGYMHDNKMWMFIVLVKCKIGILSKSETGRHFRHRFRHDLYFDTTSSKLIKLRIWN